eukprot:UN34727
MIFRKHHCRYCGYIVCGQCSIHRIHKKRICTLCLTKSMRASTNFLLSKCFQCEVKIPRGQKICDDCTFMKLSMGTTDNSRKKRMEDRNR